MRIFISYRSKERNIVEALSKDLEGLGHQVWFDKKLTGGQEWWQEILGEIYSCDLFVAALSPSSLSSEPCRLEREFARNLNKHVLPIVISKIDYSLLPAELKVVQTVSYNEGRQAAIDLGRALNSVPPPRPLPNPLPEAPPVPIDHSMNILHRRVTAPSLPYEEQLKLADELKNLLRDPEKSNSAYQLLEQLRRHRDLRASVADDISRVLESTTQPISPAPKATQPSLRIPKIYIFGSLVVSIIFGFIVAAQPSGETLFLWAMIPAFVLTWLTIAVVRSATGHSSFKSPWPLVIFIATFILGIVISPPRPNLLESLVIWLTFPPIAGFVTRIFLWITRKLGITTV